MSATKPGEIVLAIRPFTKGLAYVFAEGPLSPIDWGAKEITGAKWHARCLAAARALMDHLKPDVLVLAKEEQSVRGASGRAQRMLNLMANHAIGQSMEVRRYTRADVKACFQDVGAVSRREIAEAIASQIPAFAYRVPSPRRNWDNESPQLYLFDAAALVMAHYRARPDPDIE